ncbi:uncharacterized protein B0H64DRAFT_52503 [Chaetomium fimeti]|uniref:Secreted protein n=1 Tax=Chaetomium fimeti TaxID=1854472 RepID=A0AAE0H663_9PEZI|nr:hypothetical protein B0H64DRAFT_52503 [Chaetomium fimeti]
MFSLSFLATVSFWGLWHRYGVSQLGFWNAGVIAQSPVSGRASVQQRACSFFGVGLLSKGSGFGHMDTIRNRTGTTGRNERGLGEIGETERGLNMMVGVCSVERRDLFLAYNSGINDRRMGYWSPVPPHSGSRKVGACWICPCDSDASSNSQSVI